MTIGGSGGPGGTADFRFILSFYPEKKPSGVERSDWAADLGTILSWIFPPRCHVEWDRYAGSGIAALEAWIECAAEQLLTTLTKVDGLVLIQSLVLPRFTASLDQVEVVPLSGGGTQLVNHVYPKFQYLRGTLRRTAEEKLAKKLLKQPELISL